MQNPQTFRRTFLLATAGILAIGPVNALRAQAPAPNPRPPAFEVASVKPNVSRSTPTRMFFPPGGRFTATSAPLQLLILEAYQLKEPQLVGGQGWITSEGFDIVAKAEGDVPPTSPGGPPGPIQLMLRTLLAERFKLVVHSETRELPIYALVLARSDRRLGPRLRPTSIDWAAVMAARERGGAASLPTAPGGRPACRVSIMAGQMSGSGFPLSLLARILSNLEERVVVDRTGLMGNYELDLTWTPNALPPSGPDRGAVPLPPIDPDGPSIFTALQEQLGLRLESQKGPVDVLVIDRAERPTPD